MLSILFSTWGWNLSNRTKLLPDLLYRQRKTVDLNLEIKYPGVTHIVIRITPDDLDKHVLVNVDLHDYATRLIPFTGSISLLKALFVKSQVKKSDIGHVRYYATIGNNINVITIELKTSECTDPKHNAIVELHEPGNIGITQIQFFTVV